MALILSLETSSVICSVALHDDDRLLASAEVNEEHAHASKLALLIEKVTQHAGVPLKSLGAVAVSAGPGSYTGLRIGTSTAKGLCFALGIPLLSVGTLDVMASQVSDVVTGSLLCPMIDARRMEVYCCLFDQERRRITDVEARVIDESSFANELSKGPVTFFGNGAAKCATLITHPNAHFISGINPTAEFLGVCARYRFGNRETEDLMRFEPFYLKEFKAKLPTNLIPLSPNKI